MIVKNRSGFTIVELLIAIVIFSIVMAGLYSAHLVQQKQGVNETRRAETSIEGNIASLIIERDIMMAGYGLAEDYSLAPLAISSNPPRAVSATDNSNAITSCNSGSIASDTLSLSGTAVALGPAAAQGWTYLVNSTPTFTSWTDPLENVTGTSSGGDAVIMIDPTSKKFIPLVSPNDWLFTYRGVNNTLKSIPNQQDFPFTGLQAGTILYGLYTAGSSTVLQVNVPYYTVTYQLGGTAGTSCAPGTANLLRVENNSAQPILSCVLDFQIALGLDTDDDGSLDSWDNGGVQAGSWSGLTGPTVLNRRLKQIRLYILVQEGNQDPNYTYNNPDSTYLAAQHKTSEWIRVGDINLQGGAIGHDLQLSVAQRSYRWKVLSYAITPRNIR